MNGEAGDPNAPTDEWIEREDRKGGGGGEEGEIGRAHV